MDETAYSTWIANLIAGREDDATKAARAQFRAMQAHKAAAPPPAAKMTVETTGQNVWATQTGAGDDALTSFTLLACRSLGQLFGPVTTMTARMAEIRKTRMGRRLTRRGTTARPECWAAETTDGIWDFEREDSPGTPWLMYHRPSVADGSLPVPVRFCGTLDECRRMAASPMAGELARRKAEWAAELAAVTARACG